MGQNVQEKGCVLDGKRGNDLHLHGIDFPSLFKINIGNGEIAKFWLDKWLGDPSLSETFPRLYRLEVSKDVRVVNRPPRPANPFPNVFGPSGTYRLHFSGAWRRTPRYAEEIQELEILNNLVSQLHLSNSPDSWEFTGSASRKFQSKLLEISTQALQQPWLMIKQDETSSFLSK
ncbi:reverse transcriptase zinc-binding domain-containing protein [Artemisia annua]|uniref:Reverse transcriptase zinc-binding domain-containing protein n=1 Tax=Artemisia annua TaxID=35608 RepID=A0A2U1L5J0_ARTAN|nr:reverse transcriptase zinc-binding domain-containing protein [Artemisia annua]